jgi:uncharacterized membrane protein YadS
MQETTRAQGWAICGGAAIAALLFLIGIAKHNWWALAIPVAVVTLFALGLIAWVGFTIATIQVEADQASELLATDSPSKGAAEDAA